MQSIAKIEENCLTILLLKKKGGTKLTLIISNTNNLLGLFQSYFSCICTEYFHYLDDAMSLRNLKKSEQSQSLDNHITFKCPCHLYPSITSTPRILFRYLQFSQTTLRGFQFYKKSILCPCSYLELTSLKI